MSYLIPYSKISQEIVPFPRAIASIDFDPNGDVMLVLNDHQGQARFRVNSHILTFISPIFKALLESVLSFLEATQLAKCAQQPNSPPLDVPLRGDNPNALAVILWAAHHRTDMVPLSLNEARLYEVAVVCDKYDIRSSTLNLLLQHWIPKNVPAIYRYTPRWLFISYVFEEACLFKSITADLLKYYCHSTRVIKWDPARSYVPQIIWPIPPVPDQIKDGITNAIQKAREDIIACADTLLQSYKLLSYQCRHPDADDKDKYACDSVNFGFIERGLRKLNLHPEKRDLDAFSTQTLLTELRKLEIPFFYEQATKACCSNPTIRVTSGSKKHCICGKKYATARKLDHSMTCSPIPIFQLKFCRIYSNLDGLNLKDFLPACTK